MKKLLLLLLIFFSIQLSSCAKEKFSVNLNPHESYLILVTKPVDVVMSSDKDALKADVMTTLYNEKNQILLNVLKEGSFRLYIASGNDVAVMQVNAIKEVNEIGLKNSKLVKEIIKIDTVIKEKNNEEFPFQLDEPPAIRGGAK